VLGVYYEKDRCVNAALQFSADNDIVKSKEWANQKPENGLDGGNEKGVNKGRICCDPEKTRAGIIEWHKNRGYVPQTEASKQARSFTVTQQWDTMSQEDYDCRRAKMSAGKQAKKIVRQYEHLMIKGML